MEKRNLTRGPQSNSSGKGPPGVSSPTSCPKKGVSQVAQGLTEPGTENLQGWQLHDLPGQPVPLLDSPQGEEASLIPTLNLSCFSVFPLLLVLHHREKPGSGFLVPGTNVAISSSGSTSAGPSALPHRASLQPPDHLGGSLLSSLSFPDALLEAGGPKTRRST